MNSSTHKQITKVFLDFSLDFAHGIVQLPEALENMPTGDELQWLLKEGGGLIFESCDISLENMPTSHAVSLALVICACSDSAMPLLSFFFSMKLYASCATDT